MRRILLVAVGALGFGISAAHADCTTPPSYEATVNANTVTLCSSYRTCTSVLLRENVADGTVVAVDGSTCPNGCYVDTCVTPGVYRYGNAIPFNCSESGCGDSVPLFEQVTVANPPPIPCSPPNKSTPTTTAVPWGPGGADAGVASETPCPKGCACTTAPRADRTAVRILDGLSIALGLSLLGLRAARRRATGRTRS
jgi:hypothetical protein